MTDFLPFLVLLIILAAVLREDSVLTIFYLIVGIYFLGRFWTRHSLKSLVSLRSYPQRAFPGDVLPVTLTLRNKGWLPTAWIQIHDSLPVDMISPNFFDQALHLKGHASASFQYSLYAKKRGYYQVGPLFLRSGDLFGLSGDEEATGPVDPLIIYPQVVSITSLGLPTHSPFGNIRHRQPMYQDPSRAIGKREYLMGDSLRHVDWKASAIAQNLLVKRFEPTISLDTLIFLDLYADSYLLKTRIDATELAIVTAASIASCVVKEKQAVGIYTNGSDPITGRLAPPLIPSHKGQAHLMRILELLARIQIQDTEPITASLGRETPRLSWGTTLVLITGLIDDSFFDLAFSWLRSGLNVALVQVGSYPGSLEISRKVHSFGIGFHQIRYLSDLESWGRKI